MIIAIIVIARMTGWQNGMFPSELEGEKLTYTGVIRDIANSAGGHRLIIEIKGVKGTNGFIDLTHFKAILNLLEFETHLRPYDIIEAELTLEPAVQIKELPDDPDLTDFYFCKGIVAQGYLIPHTYIITGHEKNLTSFLYDFKSGLSETLINSSLSPECSGFMQAILLGDTENLSADDRITFSSAGLAHILALSGTHVAIISSFVLLLFLPLGRIVNRRFIYLFTILLLWCYAIMTGLIPSILRAVIMISVLFLGKILGRITNSLNSLCFAAILILIFDPASLYSVSFQLSFGAVAVILLLANHFGHFFEHKRVIGFLWGVLIISLCAMLGSGLLSAYYFHTFPVYFLAANLPVAFLLPILIGGGILLMLTGLIGFEIPFLASLIDKTYNLMVGYADHIIHLPFSIIDNIYFGAWIFVPYILTIALFAAYLNTRSKLTLGLTIVGLFMIVTFFFLPSRKNDEGIYITGNRYGTDIIVSIPGKAVALSTSPVETPDETLDRLTRKHPDFLRRRGVTTFVFMDDNFADYRIEKSGRMIWIDELSLAVFNSEEHLANPLPEGRADYGLFTSSCPKDDIIFAVQKLNVDTVLLSPDLHKNTRLKLEEKLVEHEIPYYSIGKGYLRLSTKRK